MIGQNPIPRKVSEMGEAGTVLPHKVGGLMAAMDVIPRCRPQLVC